MERGPPIWVTDKHGLPLDGGDTHVDMLWFSSDGQERPAKLHGALEGDARQALWDEHKMLFSALQEAEASKAEPSSGAETAGAAPGGAPPGGS